MNKLAMSYPILTAVLMSFVSISGNAAPTLFGVIGGRFQSPDFAGSLVKIDQDTGASEVVGTPFLDPRTGITGLAVDDVGRLIASTSEDGGPPRLIEIDPTTGGLVSVIAVITLDDQTQILGDLAFDPTTTPCTA